MAKLRPLVILLIVAVTLAMSDSWRFAGAVNACSIAIFVGPAATPTGCSRLKQSAFRCAAVMYDDNEIFVKET